MCTLPKTKATGCFDIAATPDGNNENNLGEYVHHFLMQHFIVCWKRLPQIEKTMFPSHQLYIKTKWSILT